MNSRVFGRAVPLLVAALLLSACTLFVDKGKTQITLGTGGTTIVGSGREAAESRQVSGFSAVSLSGAGTLRIEQGETESLTIRADDNLLPHLTSEVRGSTLELAVEDDVKVSSRIGIVYEVRVKRLDAIDISGGADVQAKGIDTDALTVTLSGGANMVVAGRAGRQTVMFSGGGRYAGEDLESETARVKCTGAGLVVVRVSERLDVEIEGAAAVEYIGDPEVTKQITGVGIVRKR